MSEDPFLHALRASPDDDSLRQVYADWLEERGDPRGELLRAELALRSLPPGDPRRQQAGRRWRELGATLDRDWLEKVGATALVPPWMRPTGPRSGPSGVLAFYDWVRGSQSEWVVLAVRAPVEAVARALIETRAAARPDDWLAAGRWSRGVPVRPWQEGDALGSRVPLLQARGQDWTVAAYAMFHLSLPTYYSAQEDARALSGRLATAALEFSSEDTSGALGYHLFVCGDLVEFAQWGGGADRFASRCRPRPPWRDFPRGYPDEVFQDFGLYLPGLYPRDDSDGPCVAVGGPAPGEVERADLVDLGPHFQATESAAVAQLRAGFRDVHVLHDEAEMDPQEMEADGAGEDDGIPF